MRKAIRIGICAALLALHIPALCLAGPVVVTGSGMTGRQAIKDAMRMAVEQETRVALDSHTYTRNYQTISDQIYTHAEGYITHYKILSQYEAQGQYFATIEAEVSDRMLNADLMSRFDKRAAVGSSLQDPRVGVIVLDSRGSKNAQAENALIRCLRDNGFTRIIDLDQIEQSMKYQVANAAFQNQYSLIQSIRTQFPVDYLITAKLGDTTDSQVNIQGFEAFRTGRTRLDIRMVNVNSGEILFADTVTGIAMHSYGDMAQMAAIDKAVASIRESLACAVMEKATNPEQHVQLIINGNTLGNLSNACQFLGSLPGVNNVFPRSSSYGNLRLDVDYNGTAADFMGELERHGVRVVEMNSEYIKI